MQKIMHITVEYTRTPPLPFVSKLRRFVTENRDPPGCHVSLYWVEKDAEQQTVVSSQQQQTQNESNNT